MKAETEKYIRKQIPTMVGEHHVSKMKLTTLIGLLQGYIQQSTLSESKVMEVYVPMHTEPEDDGTFQSLRWGKLRFRKEGWANGNKWKLPSGLAPVDDIIWLKKTTLSVVDHYEEQKQHSHTATDLTEPTVDIAQVGERSPCQPTPLLKNKSNYE